MTGFAATLPAKIKKKPLLAAVLACVALAASAAAAQAPPNQTLVFEGPGGRTPLNEWILRRDPANRGKGLGWATGSFSGRSVKVPNVVNPTPYGGKPGGVNYQGSVAWYRTTFRAATAGRYALSFQSANYRAEVFLDGRPLGTHRGSYLPFSFAANVKAGTHTLVVRVDWRFPGKQAEEGFHRTWFNWGGLDGEVDVRPVGASELSAPTLTTTLGASGQASVTVGVLVHNYAATRSIVTDGSLVDGTQTVPLKFAPVTIPAGGAVRTSATATIPAPALWSPAAPNLYELQLAVGTESSFSARVGLRQLTWRGHELLLNGSRLRLHGATIQEDVPGHGDALTPSDQDGIVADLKAIGANAVRAQHPLDPALLERLDAAGLLVWQGVGPVEGAGMWYSTTPRLTEEAEQQVRTAATAAALHPSIFAWNLVDEVAKNGRDEAEVRYVRDSTRWLHSNDPGRLVAVDIWGRDPPKTAGPLYKEVDAVAETDYTGWYEVPHDTPAQLAARMRERLTAMERTFPSKVLVISEFGAESNTLNKPGTPGSYAFQAQLLANHIRVYSATPNLTAQLVWVLRDYPLTPSFSGGSIHRVIKGLKLIEGLNQKGLFTYSGKAKPAAATVGALFKALPAG
ncbi:MAG TPA: glycoside hydrolase family 2 TIM barrel-domain containing protein [Solirubrobacteraceae bacterium]|nr:glycoside hydrolase family 2 TIM barrel-domain containing protein [Solirubrobacteraceae bacterium]